MLCWSLLLSRCLSVLGSLHLETVGKLFCWRGGEDLESCTGETIGGLRSQVFLEERINNQYSEGGILCKLAFESRLYSLQLVWPGGEHDITNYTCLDC